MIEQKFIIDCDNLFENFSYFRKLKKVMEIINKKTRQSKFQARFILFIAFINQYEKDTLLSNIQYIFNIKKFLDNPLPNDDKFR